MTGQWRHETPVVEPTTLPECYLYDGHGSVRGLVTGDGAINTSQVYNYTAFGSPIGFAPGSVLTPVLSPLLYSGEWWDQAAGGYDNRARIYLPEIGRFASRDPQKGARSDPKTLHRYMYGNSNPLHYADPTGRFAEFTIGGLLTTSLIGLGIGYNGALSPHRIGRRLGLQYQQADPIFGSRAEHLFQLILDNFEYAAAWLNGFTEGAAQGTLNVLNGVTDAFVGIVNLVIISNPATPFLNLFGIDPTISAPDWSYGLIFDEDRTQHAISKFLGGEGVMTLASLGVGALFAEAGQIHHVATAKHTRFWTPLFEELFGEAGLSLEHAANKVRVARHIGPHPDMYHGIVYNELVTATVGKTGPEMATALISKLEDLARRCATPGDILNYLITHP